MEPILTTTSARDETGRFTLYFPQREAGSVRQDEEMCEVTVDGETKTLRFHDYADIYAIPGLYEELFYDELECCSPEVVSHMLADEVRRRGLSMGDMRIFDVGAGNGMVGEELRDLGADIVVGADILEAAGEAAERDRPGIYDDYVVADLTKLDADQEALLAEYDFNCLVTVAALGFGDMPPEAFRVAYDMISDGGLVALTIKEEFLTEGDASGFCKLVQQAVSDGAMEVLQRSRYLHRLSVTGEELYYVAVVLEKRGDI
jgi:predicted TPR repeat methyltransferase